MIDDILKVWPLLAVIIPGAGGGLIWLVRLQGEVHSAKAGVAKICKLVSTDSGEARFQDRDDCRICRTECKLVEREKDVVIFRKLDELNAKIDATNKDEAQHRQEMYSRLERLGTLMEVIIGRDK